MRAEVAVGLGDVEVGRRCYAELVPWAGTLAGVSSGTVTLGPADLVLADLATLRWSSRGSSVSGSPTVRRGAVR